MESFDTVNNRARVLQQRKQKRKAERREHDNYITSPEVAQQGIDWLFKQYPEFTTTFVLEPGCGDTSPFLYATGKRCPNVIRTGVDIREVPNGVHQDFLDYRLAPGSRGYSLIATNPPFSLAEEFMLHSLELLAPGGLCLFLLRLAFLESQKRYELWTEKVKLLDVGVLTQRPTFTKGGSDAKTAYMFAIFTHVQHPNNPVLKFLDEPRLSWLSALESK